MTATKLLKILTALIITIPAATMLSMQAAPANAACISCYNSYLGYSTNCCCPNTQCATCVAASTNTCSCNSPITCPGGGTTCGSCPVSGICNPGQWDACGTHGCGGLQSAQCNASGTGWNCIDNPGGCSGGGGGGCVPVAPGSMPLVSPADNATVYTNAPFLYYEDTVPHGEGCPTTITYHTYVDYNCDGVGWVDYGYNHQIYNLIWGGNYCWVAQKHNGTLSANSVMRRFTVAPAPTLANYQWDTSSINKCLDNSGANVQATGRTDSVNSNNPIRFSIDITDPNSNFTGGVDKFSYVRVAIVPDAVTTASPTIWQTIQTAGASYAHFQVFNMSAAAPSFYAGDYASSPFFGSPVTTGNLPMANGKATLLNINNASGTTLTRIGSNTYRLTMQIRLENTFNNGPVGVYVMGVTQPSAGVYVSNDADGPSGQNQRYRRVASWKVDMQAPTAIVGLPTPAGSNSFTLRWQANDSTANNTGIMRIRTYCSVNGPTQFQMTDVTGGSTLLTLPTLLGSYPATSNCNITVPPVLPGAGSPLDSNRTYTYTTPPSGDLQFKVYAEDAACNSVNATNSLVDPTPWVLTANGSVSAAGGFSNFSVRTTTMAGLLVPNLTANDYYLSLYAAITGNTLLPPSKISKNEYYTTNYKDLNLNPPLGAVDNNWYDHLFRLFQVKFGGSLLTRTGPINLLGYFSANPNFSGSTSTRRYFLVNGDLTLGSSASRSVCDIKAVIFITGKLTIHPDLTTTDSKVVIPGACMFIVKGNIEIMNGTKKTTILTTSNLPATYDEVHGFFVTNGQFKTNLDDTGGGVVPDPLYIRGGVVAKSVSLNRSLGASHNPHQPAEAFDYDPFYIDYFKDVFADREFSIRPF